MNTATHNAPRQRRWPDDRVDFQGLAIADDGDIARLLATFRGEITDRLAHLEYFIGQRTCQALLDQPCGSSWELDAHDFVALARRIGQDAVGGPMFARPARLFGRVPSRSLQSRAALQRFVDDGLIAPTQPDRAALDAFFAAVEGTRLGVWHHFSAGLTQVYEAVGIENFSLMLYDDPDFIDELLAMAMDDNRRLLEQLVEYPFSFFHFGDDLGHKDGLLFSPVFLRDHWLDKLRASIEPARRRNIPLTFHSDGAIEQAIPMIIDSGFVSLNPIEPYGMSIHELYREYGDRLTLIGNIDVAGPLAG